MPIKPAQLAGLLASARRGNDKDFYNTAEALATQLLRNIGSDDRALGSRLRAFVESERKLHAEEVLDLPEEPIDKGVVTPRVGFEDLRLPRRVAETLRQVMLEIQHPEIYREHNLKPTRAILIHGPSGTGKTSIAHAIAKDSKRLLRMAVSSDLTSEYMGATSPKIRDFFKSAGASPCVMLLDECDTLLHSRNTQRTNTAREEGDITNTMLQCLDAMHPNILLVATTNLLDCVDSAALRRFDHVIEMPLPSASAMGRRAAELAARHKLNPAVLSDLDLGATYATCELAIFAAVRRQIADGLAAE